MASPPCGRGGSAFSIRPIHHRRRLMPTGPCSIGSGAASTPRCRRANHDRQRDGRRRARQFRAAGAAARSAAPAGRAERVDDDAIRGRIALEYARSNYVLCPHTATAARSSGSDLDAGPPRGARSGSPQPPPIPTNSPGNGRAADRRDLVPAACAWRRSSGAARTPHAASRRRSRRWPARSPGRAGRPRRLRRSRRLLLRFRCGSIATTAPLAPSDETACRTLCSRDGAARRRRVRRWWR